MATTKRVEFVDKMEFAAITIDQVYKLVFERAYANAKPTHLPYKFKNIANFLIFDFIVEFFKWTVVSL